MFGFSIGAASDIGNNREINQDSFAYESIMLNETPLCICCVADGMGGLSEGEYASRYAVECTIEWWKGNINSFIEENTDNVIFKMKKLFYKINREIRIYSLARSKKIGTTYSVLLFIRNTYFVIHAGDSRIYLKRGQKLYLLTKDQTWVNMQVEKGIMSVEAALAHPKKNLLVNCLGILYKPSICIGMDKIEHNDSFLLCSDGLYNNIEIINILDSFEKHDSQSCAENLVELAKNRGGRDNITAIAVKAIDINKMEKQLKFYDH